MYVCRRFFSLSIHERWGGGNHVPLIMFNGMTTVFTNMLIVGLFSGR